MANLYNDFKKLDTKQEKTIENDQILKRLEEDIRKLKIDFEIFFNGGSKQVPHEARDRVEAVIKR